MDIEQLIFCVRKHVFLYDLSNKDYKNVALKTAVWESIGRELNQSGEAVKKKWKSIRDGYTKYKKDLKNATGSSKKNVTYVWSSQLSFLDCYYGVRSGSNAEAAPSTRPETPNQYSDNSQDILSSPANSPLSSTPPLSHEMLENFQINKRKLKDVHTMSKKKKCHDGIDYLFLSYADTFKKFPPREQAIVKLELAKLFTNIELKLLHKPDESQSNTFAYSNLCSAEFQEIHPLSLKSET